MRLKQVFAVMGDLNVRVQDWALFLGPRYQIWMIRVWYLRSFGMDTSFIAPRCAFWYVKAYQRRLRNKGALVIIIINDQNAYNFFWEIHLIRIRKIFFGNF